MHFLQRLINSQRAKRPRVSCGQRLLSAPRHGLTRANFLPTPPRRPIPFTRYRLTAPVTLSSFRNSDTGALLPVLVSIIERKTLPLFSKSFLFPFFRDTNARRPVSRHRFLADCNREIAFLYLKSRTALGRAVFVHAA